MFTKPLWPRERTNGLNQVILELYCTSEYVQFARFPIYRMTCRHTRIVSLLSQQNYDESELLIEKSRSPMIAFIGIFSDIFNRNFILRLSQIIPLEIRNEFEKRSVTEAKTFDEERYN